MIRVLFEKVKKYLSTFIIKVYTDPSMKTVKRTNFFIFFILNFNKIIFRVSQL